MRVIERKQARLEFVNAVTTYRTGELRGEQQLSSFGIIDELNFRDPFTKLERGFEGFGEARLVVATYFEAIDYHIDVMFLVKRERRRIIESHHLSIHHCADKALPCKLFEYLLMFPFAAFDDWGDDHQARLRRQR